MAVPTRDCLPAAPSPMSRLLRALKRVVWAVSAGGAAAAPARTLTHAPTLPEPDAGRLDAAGRQVPPSIAQVSTPLARQHLLTAASAAALSHGRTRRRALSQT